MRPLWPPWGAAIVLAAGAFLAGVLLGLGPLPAVALLWSPTPPRRIAVRPAVLRPHHAGPPHAPRRPLHGQLAPSLEPPPALSPSATTAAAVPERLLAPVAAFLHCPTPAAWLEAAAAPGNLPVLLSDHAHCELKAAQTALQLLRRYAVSEADAAPLQAWVRPYEDAVYRPRDAAPLPRPRATPPANLRPAHGAQPHASALIDKMVPLIQEELLHFEQVWGLMADLGIPYQPVGAAGYARGLLRHVRSTEPWALADRLVAGAYIEARSCERFARLAPLLPPPLARFYTQLLRSEARHFEDYLSLAALVTSPSDLAARVAFFGAAEAELIQRPDPDFRFHSGVPLGPPAP